MLTILFFFVLDKAGLSKLFLFLVLIVIFFLFFSFGFLKLKAQIKKRASEINREVLFVGRYLLVKLYAGRPLLNALIDTSKSYGVASKYMGEIVDDIDMGHTIEEAIEKSMTYSPSEKFRKILFQINNALKLGIDVTQPLESVIEEITNDQEIEIKKYSRKLNSVVIFYMLLAIVVPSIGMTMFIVVSSFINFSLGFREFLVILFLIGIIQMIFISLFRSIRPQVNL
jgi:flagellar protein FlaJ